MEDKLIEIYDKNNNSISFGYKIFEDNKNILINNLDDQGRYDGYLLVDKSLIEQKETSEFLNKLKIYNSYWKSINIGKSDSEVFKNDLSFLDILSYAKDNNKIVSLGEDLLYYNIIKGYVEKINNEKVYIRAIDINNGKYFDDFEMEIVNIKYLEVETIDNILLDYAYNEIY
ncbi:hypothetical protein HV819_10340 [Anaerococcus sp. AGMB00486]|uniref:Ribosome maturation factor RimM n=2 Tax=Anaerococcus TaxID=165779 RepID=A0ABX2NCL4_9FIRM|nr:MULTISPECIES: hypothetical protein [Anaerococcus]MDY3006507.1 hypothetical protein [Anaerococcus porci]MSS77893.1 hypothetical protein [Anaerococcus porci]NVF12355.1 hypothetical protein [Anaerococcus faecalis]